VLLAIDVGNTQTQIGVFRSEELVESWRLATDREATVDMLGAQLAGLLSLRDLGMRDVDGVIVSSVVPQLGHEYELMSDRYFEGALQIVGPGIKTGMAIKIDSPREVGADRLVNSVAAYDRIGGACVVVDFGTGINFDAVSEAGEYLGGAIAPGLEISLTALVERAARIPRIDLAEPETAVGRSSRAAIQSGVVFGFAGLIDGVIRRMEEELGEVRLLATGGLAGAIVPFTETIDEVDEMLTLKGLRLIHERNAPTAD
jgi:type III pantothenate kinase